MKRNLDRFGIKGKYNSPWSKSRPFLIFIPFARAMQYTGWTRLLFSCLIFCYLLLFQYLFPSPPREPQVFKFDNKSMIKCANCVANYTSGVKIYILYGLEWWSYTTRGSLTTRQITWWFLIGESTSLHLASDLKTLANVKIDIVTIPWRIHGTGIFTYMKTSLINHPCIHLTGWGNSSKGNSSTGPRNAATFQNICQHSTTFSLLQKNTRTFNKNIPPTAKIESSIPNPLGLPSFFYLVLGYLVLLGIWWLTICSKANKIS